MNKLLLIAVVFLNNFVLIGLGYLWSTYYPTTATMEIRCAPAHRLPNVES